MVIVFDADIFEEKVHDYNELIEEVNKEPDTLLAISNPSFELFLLLHFENAFKECIKPNEQDIVKNEKKGNQTFIYKLLLLKTGMNSKKNPRIGELAKNIDIAIAQEKKINEDISLCKGQITCNVAAIIDQIKRDDGIDYFS